MSVTAMGRILIVATNGDGSAAQCSIESTECAIDLARSLEEAVDMMDAVDYDWVVLDSSVLADPDLFALARLAKLESDSMHTSGQEHLDWQMVLAEVVANSTEASLAYLDPSFRFVWANNAYVAMVGIDRENLIGSSYLEMFDDEQNEEAFVTARDSGKPFVIREKPLHLPGSEAASYWNWTLVPVRRNGDPVGTTRGFALTLVDVTHDVVARREIEALREKAERQAHEMSVVFASLNDAVFVIDSAAFVVYANPAAEKAFGADPVLDSAYFGEGLMVERPDGSRVEKSERPYYRAIKGENVKNEHFRVVNKRSEELFVLVSASPLVSEDGFSGAVVVWHDITDLTQAEQRDREREAQVMEFLRRTILLATNGRLIVTDRDEIDRIAGAAVAAWDLRKPSDLSVVRQGVQQVAENAGMSPSQWMKMLTALGEATTNALKHAQSGRVSVHRLDDRLFCIVSDTGPGISYLSLPNVALEEGYSTAGTGGMGYKLIIASSPKVYLATGSEGTTIAFEVALT